MDIQDLRAMRRNLSRFVKRFDGCIKTRPSRDHLRTYVRGQVSDVERKSVEPIALEAGVAPRSLQKFLEEHRADFGEAFEAAKLIYEKASAMAEEKDVDIREILTGDLVADRALLEAAGVESEIEATGFSIEGGLELVQALLKLGTIVAGVVA